VRRSTDRILVTHVGSLVRPVALRELLARRAEGKEVDCTVYERVLRESVDEAVRMQVEAGVDIPSDGEYGKTGWTSYVLARLSGLEPLPADQAGDAPINPRTAGREGARFLDFYNAYQAVEAYDWHSCDHDGLGAVKAKPKESGAFQCTAPIRYNDLEIRRDIANFKAALGGVRVEEAFMPVAAPESARGLRRNRFYASDDEFLEALADALRIEYLAILDAGFLIQLDDAFLAHEYDRLLVSQSQRQVHRGFHAYIEMLNHSLRDIPEEKVRYHVCWGSWNGPHTSDVPLKTIIDLVLKVRAQAYAIESANPRHEHEFQLWNEIKLPDGKILIPGLVTHSTNVVEHPELVATRIKNFARLVGRENVIAGTDCGFSQSWNTIRVHPLIQWAKLASLAEGARLASKELWPSSGVSRVGLTVS
jgi:5-methyltetrahydropteroyltriglutamate--homocysteine methyltransferase